MNLVYALFGMIATAIFVVLVDEDVNAFSERQENEDTQRKLCMIYRFLGNFSKVGTSQEK